MESTIFSKTRNENFNGTTETANKLFSEVSSTVIDVYSKQLNLLLGFYNNLFNFFPGINKNTWAANMDFIKPINGDGTLNSVFAPFNVFKMNGHLFHPFTNRFEDLYKQTNELNAYWISAFQNSQSNWNELNKKSQEIIEEGWKNTFNIINSMIDVYNKQMDFSNKSGQKLVEGISNQINLAIKRSETFWSDILETAPVSNKTENEKPQPKKQNKADLTPLTTDRNY
jgi:hypothetical protein